MVILRCFPIAILILALAISCALALPWNTTAVSPSGAVRLTNNTIFQLSLPESEVHRSLKDALHHRLVKPEPEIHRSLNDAPHHRLVKRGFLDWLKDKFKTVANWLKDKLNWLLDWPKIALRHLLGQSLRAIGWSRESDVIPNDVIPMKNMPLRDVYITSRPIAGKFGAWVHDKILHFGHPPQPEGSTGPPDEDFHWETLVGDYVHTLDVDKAMNIIYVNDKFDGSPDWRKHRVGKTALNDQGVRLYGRLVMDKMRGEKPGYNLINWNCQDFTINLLANVLVDGVEELLTADGPHKKRSEPNGEELQAETPE